MSGNGGSGIYDIGSSNSFAMVISVTKGGVAFPLTGATVVGHASADGGATTVAATIDMSDAALGEIRALWVGGSFDDPMPTTKPVMWECQVEATLGDEKQTIGRDFLRVFKSI